MDALRDSSRTVIERSGMSLPRSVLLAAVVGGAFGFGLMAGDGGAAHANEGDAASDLDPIARAEARTAAYEKLVKASTSSWHAEIMAPEPKGEPVISVAAKKAAAVAAASAATAAVEEASSAPTADADVVKAVREPVAAPEHKVAESAPAARDKNDDTDDQEGDVDAPVAPDPARLSSALKKVMGDKPAAAADERHYALQLASTGTEAGARAIADGYAARGFAAGVVSSDIAGRGTVYRVRIGGLASRAAADALKARVGQGLVVTE